MAKYFKGLPEKVAAKYDCLIEPTEIITRAPQRERVDLRKISVSKADALVKKGALPFLVPKNEQKKGSEEKK